MHNQEAKNWNNFFLGLIVVVLPWLSLPEKLKAGSISFLALLIVLFSLARVGAKRKSVIITSTEEVNNAGVEQE